MHDVLATASTVLPFTRADIEQTVPARFDQVVRRVKVLEKVELGLRLEHVEPVLYCVTKPRLRVRKHDRSPLRLFDKAKRTSVGLNRLLGQRMRIDERSTGNEESMDMAQGVHDALGVDSSQR